MDKHIHTVGVYNKYVREYVNKFMDLGLYRDTFDSFLELIPQNARVIELGCGPGNVVKYMRATRKDLQISGIDLAPEMINEAKRQNPGVQFEVMDIRDADQITGKFEVVITAFCLPYLSYEDVPGLFKNIENLSAGNGLLYLSCMEGSPDRSGFEKTSFTGEDEMYINYYDRHEIHSYLKSHNFKIESFFTKDYPESDGSVTTDLIFIARKISDT